MQLNTAYDIGDQVTIDRDDSGVIVGLILAVQRPRRRVECNL